jgi:hypothetical protein
MMSTLNVTGRGRRGRVRCYRSAALATGSSGTLVVVPWDAESSVPAKYGFTHSTSVDAENIVCTIGGDYQLTAHVKLVAGTWNEMRGSVEVNTTPKHTPNCGAAGGLLGLSPGPSTLVLSCPLRLVRGDVVRVRIASVGQGSVSLNVGETDTWLELSPL